ncbi:MAG: cation diffusion facilitator family transporter [Alphaproteobacteria bacterium]|nr:cation diffusion facilitator family transporter [Alphaproteobacteria bacterium]
MPERTRLAKAATTAAVTVACVLIVAKFFAWMITDSVALLSSLVDSAMDGLASLVNLVAVRGAMQPADREHRFGHDKLEPLATLGQAAFIAGSAAFLTFEAVHRFIDPRPAVQSTIGIGVLVFAILATGALVAFQRYVVQRTGSTAIAADALHYRSDLLVNGSVIVSLLLAGRLGWWWADPLFAFGIAVYILRSAWEIAKGAIDILTDREFPEAERERIKAIVREDPRVINVHDLRTRSTGTRPFIQLHMELDPQMPLIQAHRISDDAEERLMAVFPGAEIIVHQDPAGVAEPVAFPERVR